ncbi:MAG: NUDIX hydrolase [Rhodocyclaceae bacterium]|nr:NUDIX hydrolase [Rhodocyclaceae bacterium]MBX3667756.1 NUDIX hydrolase [Rhodocyclaceae bacterium]
MTEHLEETEIESQSVYDGGLLKVRRDQVRLPDGSEAWREYIRHPGAVAVIARSPSGNLVFVRQFRYPLRQALLEIPAGKIDSGEAPFSCAQRELREETGYLARKWTHLGLIHTCVAYSDERIELYLAEDLEHVGACLDEGEFLDVLEISIDDALRAVWEGGITDSKTVCAMLWVQRLFATQD